MFKMFERVFFWTIAIGLGFYGLIAGFAALGIIFSMTQSMLSSGFGTLLFIAIVYLAWKIYRETNSPDYKD